MSKRSKPVRSSEWETAVGAGFPPIWSPEENESIEVSLVRIKQSSLKEGKKVKKNWLLECSLLREEGTFTRGSGKNKAEVLVEVGELVSLPLSSGITGERFDDERIAYQETEKSDPQFTKLGKYCQQNNTPLRFTFKGKSSLAGGRTFKSIIVQTPRGTLENVRNLKEPIDKRGKK